MRVAFFTETFLPKVDGISTVLCLLFEHLARRGIESVVFTPRYGGLTQVADTQVVGVSGFRLPWYPELKLAFPVLAHYPQLARFRPDVTHIVNPVVVGIGGLWMSRWLGVPVLASFHIDIGGAAQYHRYLRATTPFFNWLARSVYLSADAVLAPSVLMQQRLNALGVPDVGVWGRGVDCERFDPRFKSVDMRNALSDGDPDALLLIYVGRLSPEKRLRDLRPLLEAVPGVRVALVGDGPDRAALQAYLHGLPVTFMGYLAGEALAAAYASADALVFPSAFEAFGLVVTEAMASGIAVVAARVGGVPAVIEEGVTGYTFAPGDIGGLINSVRALLAQRQRLPAMGAAARAFALTQAWDAKLDEVITHYQHLIDRQGNRPHR
ncbi:MAG: glycosyltransferase [Armatimonadetes bacterium]|nr:glycosyltransferase [Anaerolineae bacterium]